MSATVRPSFSGKIRGIRLQKVMPLPEKGISVLACVPRPQTGTRESTIFLPGQAKRGGSPPAARRGTNETVVPTCRSDFLQVVSGTCRMSFGILPGDAFRPVVRAVGAQVGGMPLPVQAGERSAASPARKKCLPAVKDAAAGEGCLCGPACAVVAAGQRQWRR